MIRFLRRLLPPAFAALAAASPLYAKELRWRSLEVRARLDSAGALHVVERHAMVFTGDWNGGERTFRVAPGQHLGFEGISRITPDGQAHPLAPGSLSAVDEFAWKDPRTLRWRSRLPSDPGFDNTEIVYEVSYALSGILVKQGNRYLLDHDFAFPDRAGAIESFHLDLSLDSSWRPEGAFRGSLERRGLTPGEGVVLRIPLAYVGAGRPAAGRSAAAPAVRWALFGAFAASVFFLLFSFWSGEKALGRSLPLVPAEKIDQPWLEVNLLSLLPEEAGALWDEKIGPPEVAAVLARLCAEKKIETQAEGKKLTMRLRVPMSEFSGYDHELVKALFFGGRTETDTDAIRAHYKSSGFDPAAKIREGLEARLQTHPDFRDRAQPLSHGPTLLLFGSAVAALALSVVFASEDLGTVIGLVLSHLFWWAIGTGCAVAFRRRVDRLAAFAPLLLLVPALFLYSAFRGALGATGSSLLLVAGVTLLRLAIVRNILNLAKTRNGPKRIGRRKTLAAARRFFARELGSPAPRLKDEWFPYVLAFGLTGDAGRWFRSYGAAQAAASSGTPSRSSGASSSSTSGGGWTGGGGSFGGAGASASWAVAAGALAAGVASPSSSSGGGGGGGGGGGSSGGGGGGGW